MNLSFFKYPMTTEENRTLKVTISCIAVLEFSIIFSSIKYNISNVVHGILLSVLLNIIFISSIFFIRLYELYICFSADYILYVIEEGDTLLNISYRFLPECNPWLTIDFIKKKNLLKRDVLCGDKILIPTRK